ncbi:hypothetical protein [Erythrobacter sp. HKB08]|uniref:tetratricopeptide repeat protein n=1 Tax=Erythrobacter sp. HKB08 TaxID=2502843 RepID=UPI001008AE46|nr:hypothetical protein [Erythrobacter sp. HKB08]
MNSIRRLFSALAAALTLVAMPASAQEWYRADTDNFIILSSGSEENIREWALKLERFDALMRLRYRIPSDPSPNRLTVYVLGDSRDVMESLTGGKQGSVAGYYSSQLDGSYAVTQRTIARRGELSGQEVLFHEYGHHFMYRYFPFAYPGWYREGFAEYYATTEFDEDGNWNYGKPPIYRGSTLTGIDRQISFKKMLTTPQAELDDFESYQVYTRGWLLVHMLHSDPERGRQLNDFLIRVGNGEDRKAAAEAAFGDLDELDREARRYMGKSPTYIRGREPIEYTGRFDVVKLDSIDSRFEELRLANRRTRFREETRDKLRALAEEAPGRIHIWNELADAEHMVAHSEQWKESRRAARAVDRNVKNEDIERGPVNLNAAIAAVDRALEIDPENYRANALKAEFLMDVARDNDQPSLWAEGRAHAITANRVRPDDPFPLSLFYDSYAEAGEEIPDMARSALARAFELAPESEELRVDYALDLALQGRTDTAVDVVEFLLASPHSEDRGKLALQQIEAIKNGATFLEASEMKLDDEEEEDA